MIKLLRADLARMWKNKSFRCCMIITFLVSFTITYIIIAASSVAFDDMNWSQIILAFSAIPIFTSAAFSALFIGDDYSDNTIRNKLIIGRTRIQIYFANLLTVIIGSLVIAAAGELTPVSVAAYGGKKCFLMPADSFALGIVICVCALIASCALFTLIGMLITKKSTSVVLALILMIGAYVAESTIRSKLEIPQTYIVSRHNEDGTIDIFEEDNPEAVSGGARVVMEAIYNTLPFGEIKQAEKGAETGTLLPLYSLGVMAASTVIGATVFRKKDLK